jgi:hypothetical protein
MKKLSFVFVLVIAVSAVFEQAQSQELPNPAKTHITKGKFFVGGSSRLDFIAGNLKHTNSDFPDEERITSIITFNFQPRAGYYFINNLVTGLFIDMGLTSQKEKVDTVEYRGNYISFTAGPFARYYFPVTDKLIPFVEGQVGFGFSSSNYKSSDDNNIFESKGDVFTLRVGGGATYFFNDKVGADLFIGYEHHSYKDNYETGSGGDSNIDTKTYRNVFVLQLGVIVILG